MGRREWSRREFVAAMGAGAAALATGLAGAAPRRRPNFLFLFTDDQRCSTLHAVNNPDVQTPNLDKLAARGTVFAHPYIMGSTSGAVCICSRTMLLTGRSLFRSPYLPKASDGLALWPETFRKAGYATFGTGKWHNGPQAYARSFTHGGSIFFGGMSDHLRVPVHDFDPTGTYPRSARHVGAKFSSELFSDAAIGFLRSTKGDKPFLMYVSYTAPHDPRMAPKAYADRYPPDKIPVPPNFLPEHPFDNGEMRIRDERLAPWPRTPQIVREHIAAYYAMITHSDAQVGRVLDALEASGHADNTIVVFAGDNGLAVGQHGLMGKQSLYEHSLSVPLIFAGPGIPSGQRRDALVYLHDLFPTTCQLAGIDVPPTVESLSLVPVLTGSRQRVRDSIFGAYKSVQRSVRTERWKLIRYPYAKQTQLFDLQADPWETRNLAAEPRHAKLVEELNGRLRAWQKKVGDTLDIDNPPPRAASRGFRKGMPVRPRPDGSFVLEPKTARVTGRLAYQPDRNNLGAWFDRRDCPQWTLLGVQPGAYQVEFTYGCTNPGVAYTIAAGGQELASTTVHTGGIKTYKPFKLGALTLPGGTVTVAVKPGKFEGAFMNFRLIRLARLAP